MFKTFGTTELLLATETGVPARGSWLLIYADPGLDRYLGWVPVNEQLLFVTLFGAGSQRRDANRPPGGFGCSENKEKLRRLRKAETS